MTIVSEKNLKIKMKRKVLKRRLRTDLPEDRDEMEDRIGEKSERVSMNRGIK